MDNYIDLDKEVNANDWICLPMEDLTKDDTKLANMPEQSGLNSVTF